MFGGGTSSGLRRSGRQRADGSARTAAASDSRVGSDVAQQQLVLLLLAPSSAPPHSSSASASAARRAARMAVPRDIEASASTRAACAHSARSRPICAGVWGDSYSYSWWMCVCMQAVGAEGRGALQRGRPGRQAHKMFGGRQQAAKGMFAWKKRDLSGGGAPPPRQAR